MRLADLLTGSSFRTSAKVAIGVLVLVCLGGTLFIWSATGALREATKQQALEEAVLLSDVYSSEGRAGLVRAIGTLSNLVNVQERVSTVFDEKGINLAGADLAMPDFIWCARPPRCNLFPLKEVLAILCCRSRSSPMLRL